MDWDPRWIVALRRRSFRPLVSASREQLPTPAVISLFGARDGSLRSEQLPVWLSGRTENSCFPETTGRVNSIYEDRKGTIWMARSRTHSELFLESEYLWPLATGLKMEYPPMLEH